MARPPEAPFQISLPGFDGTAPDLCDLVQQRKLPVGELPLAELTAQFAAHLAAVPEPDLDETGEFLRAAARLLLLKSAMLLPQLVEETEVEEGPSPARYGPSGVIPEAVAELAVRQGAESFPPLPRALLIERPVEPFSALLLRRAWSQMESRRGPEAMPVSAPPFVRLEVALSRLIRRLAGGAAISFRSLLRGVNRNDAVVHFLALLELIRRRQASVSQTGLFEDIAIERAEREAASRSRAG